MSTQEKDNKLRTSSILNIVAGGLFIIAAFNFLTGDPGINWMYIIVGVLFIGGGAWGLKK